MKLTTTTCSRPLRFCPYCLGSEPEPVMNPPPWIHTITGSRSSRVRAGVQTLRYRQSSLCPVGSEPPPMVAPLWGQEAPKRVQVRTPVHGRTGCGGRQRRSPTGGAA